MILFWSPYEKGGTEKPASAIKSGFGEDHPALQVVGFDAETWTQINQPIHDRVEDRLQNTRFLTDPDAIVSRAETLLPVKLPLGPIWQSASASSSDAA